MQYIGVDVAKASLQVSDVSGTRQGDFPNTPEGIDRLLHWLAGPQGLGELS